jgi:transporter family-2 protein
LLALLLACLAGAGLSLQAFVNGRLNSHLGSPELVSCISFSAGTISLLLIVLATGRLKRAVHHSRTAPRPRWWHLLVCVLGPFPIIVGAKAAPELGVALLTVALVCGQTTGSLVIDAIGMSPSGRQRLTVARVLGVVLALVAVTVVALGSDSELNVGLLLLSVLSGVITALVQAVLGHLAETTGDPLTATGLLFVIGLPISILCWLVLVGPEAPDGWSAPVEQWVSGGVIGACCVSIMALVVRSLGVLRLTLVLVAGQSLGGLALDAIAPAEDGSVTVQTVISVLITFAAVGVSGMARLRPAPAPGQDGRGEPQAHN